MRVGIVVPAYNRRGGLERVAVEYARGLAARGHEIEVFAGAVEREEADEAIRFRRLRGPRRNKALRAAVFPLVATRAVSAATLDTVISFGSSVTIPAVQRTPGAHRSWWQVANREWPVTTAEGLRRRLNPHHRIVLAWDRRIMGAGLPRVVLAAGTWAADDIRRFYPRLEGKVRVLPDGVNLDEFSFDPEGRAAMRERWGVGDGPVLLTVATELRRKGLATLFDAVRLVRAEIPQARLIVGGRVPVQDVRALAVHHRVEHGVRAVGFIDDLRAAYSAADVFVFPTRFDPWGLPIVEALACGTRVAASARAGASSVIRPGETGATITDPADPKMVALGAVSALALREDREEARASVAHLSWDRVVAELEAILEQTLA